MSVNAVDTARNLPGTQGAEGFRRVLVAGLGVAGSGR
jgi:hypothetical protein